MIYNLIKYMTGWQITDLSEYTEDMYLVFVSLSVSGDKIWYLEILNIYLLLGVVIN